MTRTQRLDLELVRRGLTGSRTEAQRAIEQGQVIVRGMPASRASSLVTPDDPISLRADAARFVSRGGDKLDGALSGLDVRVEGRRWLDVGASTGGFTDRLLQGGAAEVTAVDVGYGQFDWGLRNDPRVTLLERTNVRDLTTAMLPWVPEAVAADLSFISLCSVIPVLGGLVEPNADHLLLVKPQFEVGRERVGKGVVHDPAGWRIALDRVVRCAEEEGLGLRNAALAEPPGPAGNREFFLHLQKGAPSRREVIEREVERALSQKIESGGGKG